MSERRRATPLLQLQWPTWIMVVVVLVLAVTTAWLLIAWWGQ
jgi:hypothetical protein